MTKLPKRPFDFMKMSKSNVPLNKHPRSLISVKKPMPGSSISPSVSIAPVGKRPLPVSRPTSDTDSEAEDIARKPILKPKRMLHFI